MADPEAGAAGGGAAGGVAGVRAPSAPAPARFQPGDLVRARPVDPAHHTRLPRYARGHLGRVEHVQPASPLPDDRARGVPSPRVEPVYTVRFAAKDLWGAGEHTVTVDLWESYLEPVPS
jgi:nitrile hydratase